MAAAAPPQHRSDVTARYRRFHGRMTREAAERVLEDQPPGTFFVRERDTAPGSYVLSLKVPDGVMHWNLYFEDGCYHVGVSRGARGCDLVTR